MDTLFDETERTETRPKNERESTFSYLNISAREGVAAARAVLQQWFDLFPMEARKDLAGRLRSPIDGQHFSAFWELYLHETFSQVGYKLEVHPKIEGSPNRPDFLVHVDGVPSFYLEGIVAGLPSTKDAGAQARLAEVLDLINKMPPMNYFLEVQHRGIPGSQPPVRKLRKDLEEWLRSLDINGKERAQFKWSHDGLTLLFGAIPKSVRLDKPAGRPIGVTMGEAQWLRTDEDIRDAVEVKAKKYGELSLPLVVAVNVKSEHCDDVDVNNALFGDETIELTPLPDKSHLAKLGQRRPNGIWLGSAGPRNRLVNAILIGCDITVYTCAITTPVLIHNPHPIHKIALPSYPLPQLVPDNETNTMKLQEGISANTYLRLPNPWPPKAA